MATITVAAILSLVFLAVEKHHRTSGARDARHGQGAVDRGGVQKLPWFGILLSLDPRLAGDEQFPPTDKAPLRRTLSQPGEEVAQRLRRPPEPAANVALRAPVAMVEMNELPLHASSSQVDYLMDVLDEALESPIQVTSLATRASFEDQADPPKVPIPIRSSLRLPAPEDVKSKLPVPSALFTALAELREQPLALAAEPVEEHLVWSRSPFSTIEPEVARLSDWIARAEHVLNQLVYEFGLEHPAGVNELDTLSELAEEGKRLGEEISSYELASRLLRVSYALQRRVAVWGAIQACLDGNTIDLSPLLHPEIARQEILPAIEATEALLDVTQNGEHWHQYLQLDELRQWARGSENGLQTGPDLAAQVLARIERTGLTPSQRDFLEHEEFVLLADKLRQASRTPVEFRRLVSELEQIEEDPISRSRTAVANTVQILRGSSQESQQQLAHTINSHYRNANLRVAVAGELLDRFLPNGDYEWRPVRQRILGADTRGNSAVKTTLSLELIPDDSAWSVGLGVTGDMHSNTRSSKGPATFHNTSRAQIDTQRYIRMHRQGYEVTSQPTNVRSRETLRKMSTNFDGLPVFGEFLRLVIREQFNQKRNLAQRVTRRLIAQETDAELDRRLQESLAVAQTQLQEQLVGPLERLRLNPLVVDMNTTQQRLTIRYRVAGAKQLAAQTARPRAPSDSLMSIQLHESAINNAITQLGLAGRTWTIEELTARVAEVFGKSSWALPLEVRDEVADIKIRFADTRPATIEMRDGRLRLTLRIAELSQPGRLHIERFLVHSSYIPYADGLDAGLVRDGVVEIVSNQGVGDRLTLRVIFAKIFVSHPEVPLISEKWRDDERAAGLAVSQLDIVDGWLAVAISEANSVLAAEVAARARELQQLR